METEDQQPEVIQTIPTKPELNSKKNLLIKSLLSLGISVFFFQYYFDKDLTKTLLLISTLVIHELGHFLMMYAFGYKELKMFFIPLIGAFVSGRKSQISPIL